MELEWQLDFETGNEYVDLQHRYFVDLINRVGINFRDTDDVVYKEKLIAIFQESVVTISVTQSSLKSLIIMQRI
jgi:hemerythrin